MEIAKMMSGKSVSIKQASFNRNTDPFNTGLHIKSGDVVVISTDQGAPNDPLTLCIVYKEGTFTPIDNVGKASDGFIGVFNKCFSFNDSGELVYKNYSSYWYGGTTTISVIG